MARSLGVGMGVTGIRSWVMEGYTILGMGKLVRSLPSKDPDLRSSEDSDRKGWVGGSISNRFVKGKQVNMERKNSGTEREMEDIRERKSSRN